MIKTLILFVALLLIVGIGVTFVIFYTPDLSREDLAPRYVNTESEFIDLPNGATMYFRDQGNSSGLVLVMVHGGFGSLHNWEGWVQYLKDDFRLITMDLLGYGLIGKYPDNLYGRHTDRDAVHMLLRTYNIRCS